jgi:hypothetical protein
MHAIIPAADAAGEPLIALRGDPHFYRRFGFVEASRLGIAAPDPGGVPTSRCARSRTARRRSSARFATRHRSQISSGPSTDFAVYRAESGMPGEPPTDWVLAALGLAASSSERSGSHAEHGRGVHVARRLGAQSW